jgi:prophage regulatory protein
MSDFQSIHSDENLNAAIVQGTGNDELASPMHGQPQTPIRILRLPDVIERVGLKRASIYLHIAHGNFPKQITLGERAVGWIESEIDAWLAARISARGKQEGKSV